MSIYDDLQRMLEEMSRKPGTTGNVGRVGQGILPLAKGLVPWQIGAANAIYQRLRPQQVTAERKNLRPGGSFGSDYVGNFFKGQTSRPYQDPLAEMLNNLLTQLQQPVGVDADDLMSQIKAQFDPIYNERARSAESRTERGRSEVEGMYEALAKDYERLAPEQAAQAEEYQADIESLYGQLRSNIEGHYSRVSDEQTEMMKQLGIEAAAPDVLTPQSESAVNAMNSAAELGAINEQRALDIGNIDEAYYREGSPLASLTGTNISKDMIFELNDYLQNLEAEKTSGIQQAFNQLYGQAQGQAAQTQSQNTQMLWQILQSQMQNQSQPMDANTFLSTLPPQIGAEVAQAFTGLQRSEEAVYGRVEDPRHPTPGTFVPLTPEWYFKAADDMLAQGRISASTHQALMMYLQLRTQG